jgi:hypothetical protein
VAGAGEEEEEVEEVEEEEEEEEEAVAEWGGAGCPRTSACVGAPLARWRCCVG